MDMELRRSGVGSGESVGTVTNFNFMKEGRTGRKEGRKAYEGRKEGRKEGRTGGRKEGRKEERKGDKEKEATAAATPSIVLTEAFLPSFPLPPDICQPPTPNAHHGSPATALGGACRTSDT